MPDLVLGIESSCDECAASVVQDGRAILSSIVESQIHEHAPFGGVVPEIASRSHLRSISVVVERALAEAGVDLDAIDAIAVTTRPGLIGSLLVGTSLAKGLAWMRELPLVAVHHIEAHVYSAAMESDEGAFPSLALVVSGGHTALYEARSPLEITRIGETLDDAAGECFDKTASLLGLPYPGGPAIARLAERGDPRAVDLPRYADRRGGHSFSFSGLKTALLYHLRGQDALAPTPPPEAIPNRADLAASLQEAVVDQLCATTIGAASKLGLETILVGGGVAANRRLRQRLSERAEAEGLSVRFPDPALCTDNAAMVAGLGWQRWRAGAIAPLDVDACAR